MKKVSYVFLRLYIGAYFAAISFLNFYTANGDPQVSAAGPVQILQSSDVFIVILFSFPLFFREVVSKERCMQVRESCSCRFQRLVTQRPQPAAFLLSRD